MLFGIANEQGTVEYAPGKYPLSYELLLEIFPSVSWPKKVTLEEATPENIALCASHGVVMVPKIAPDPAPPGHKTMLAAPTANPDGTYRRNHVHVPLTSEDWDNAWKEFDAERDRRLQAHEDVVLAYLEAGQAVPADLGLYRNTLRSLHLNVPVLSDGTPDPLNAQWPAIPKVSYP